MKDIKGYEGKYAITSCGKVWSYKRKIFLKPSKNRDGYHQVTLYNDKGKSCCFIHKLVAETYMPNPQKLSEINHIDEDKSHNYIRNLEYCTHKYNVHYSNNIKKLSLAKYKPVCCIELGKIYESILSAANETKTNKTSISNCINGRLKTAGGFHWKYA